MCDCLHLCRIESPLAQLYGTSTMEHHHFDHSIMILNSEVTCFMYLITLLGPIINTVLLYTAEEKRIAFPEL